MGVGELGRGWGKDGGFLKLLEANASVPLYLREN